MESRKSILLRIPENSGRRWCGLCGELIISEFGTVVQGTSLTDHACFKNSEALDVDGKYVYPAGNVEQQTVQHPVVLQSVSPNLTANGGLRRFNLIPMNMKKVLGTFSIKSPNTTNNLIIAKDTNSNGAQHQALSQTGLRSHSPPPQHILPNIDTLRGEDNDDSQRNWQNLIQHQRIQKNPLQCNPVASDIQGASVGNNASLSSQIGSSPGYELFDAVSTPVPCLQKKEHAKTNQISHQDSASPQNIASTISTKEDMSPGTLRWSTSMVKLLLESYTKHKKYQDEGCYITKKNLHQRIGEDMKKHNYNDITVDQIASKLKRLKKSYKDKVDNMGSKQSGAERLDIPYEDELVEAFGKKHAIHPTHLSGTDWEYTKEDNNIPEEDVKNEMSEQKIEETSEKGGNGVATKKDGKQKIIDDGVSEPCNSKKKRYVMNLTPSENSIKMKHHLENLERKDKYIELKKKELELKAGNKKRELAIKEQSKKEFLEIQKMKLALETKKLQAQYPNFQFDVTEEQ
ncbi:hypothetical protein QAD02_013044 [Eretmocerus hayati]|uniref:Uncharacterized protein n=1 Tax=Eretmocerus hayati TaxID=131215 RepID=A0ACC2P1K7_9HYME|nr:hypothetical protein QAD02_013044 [Eretmocerus hayati]